MESNQYHGCPDRLAVKITNQYISITIKAIGECSEEDFVQRDEEQVHMEQE